MELFIYTGSLPEDRLRRLLKRASSPFTETDISVKVLQSEPELESALQHTIAQEAARQERYFPMRTDTGTHLLRLSRVLYFQSEGHRFHAFLTDGTVLRSRSLRIATRALLSGLLERGQLLQVSKSTFVNTQQIISISLDGVHLTGDQSVPISRKYYAEFMAANRQNGAS